MQLSRPVWWALLLCTQQIESHGGATQQIRATLICDQVIVQQFTSIATCSVVLQANLAEANQPTTPPWCMVLLHSLESADYPALSNLWCCSRCLYSDVASVTANLGGDGYISLCTKIFHSMKSQYARKKLERIDLIIPMLKKIYELYPVEKNTANDDIIWLAISMI